MDKSCGEDKPSSSGTVPSTAASSSDQSHLVWEIKGQYHVKCTDDKDSSDSPQDSSSDVKMSSDSPDIGCLEKNEKVASVEDSSSSEDEGNVSSPRRTSKRDWQVLKWQTRQVAKAFVDNTINCVLEDMGYVPLPADAVGRYNTEDLFNGGNLEHEAVSMAILSHGLQRSDHETPTTSSHVTSRNSYSNKNNSPLSSFLGEPSNLTKAESVHKPILPNNQAEASCSRSSKQVSLNSSEIMVTLKDSDCVPTVSIMTAEHSNLPFNDMSNLQSLRNTSPSIIFTKPQADCDLISHPTQDESQNMMLDELPSSACACSLSRKLMSPQKETLSPPFHKRKAEDTVFAEGPKRCCNRSCHFLNKQEHNHTVLNSSSDESVSNVQKSFDKVPSFEHFDFMDAAVAVAIQKKGLSAMTCTEYG